MKNKLFIFSSLIFLPIATISCNNINLKHGNIKNSDSNSIKNSFTKLQVPNKNSNNPISKQIYLNHTQTLSKYSQSALNITENIQDNFYEEEYDQQHFSSIINLKKITKKWLKKTRVSKQIKLQSQKSKRNSKIISSVSWALGISSLLGVGLYLFKYNRNPLHKTGAYIVDFGIKSFLKYMKVDLKIDSQLRDLLFNIFRENDFEGRKIINWLLNKLKDAIYNKKFENIITKEEAKGWIESYKSEDKDENKPKVDNDNPISHVLQMLKGENRESVLASILALMKFVKDKETDLKKVEIFNKKIFEREEIYKHLKSDNNADGITSSLVSLAVSFGFIKNGIDFLFEQAVKRLPQQSDKQGLLTLLIDIIKSLKVIINESEFKIKYKDELQVLYDLLYNLIKLAFGEQEIINKSFFLFNIRLKITDIITPLVIKNYMENLTSNNSNRIKKAN